MRGAVIHAPGDVRFEDRPDPVIVEPTDAVIRTVAACVCGSDLWRYRGVQEVTAATPIGHEYVGIVEQVGDAVTTVQVGDFVVGGFLHSDSTCPVCRHGHARQLPARGRLRRLPGGEDPHPERRRHAVGHPRAGRTPT
jgi:threonine dehydrogenase-like Zn-dependent dehydrogenase